MLGRPHTGPRHSLCPSPVPSELFQPHGGRVTSRHCSSLGKGPVALLNPSVGGLGRAVLLSETQPWAPAVPR